MTCDVCLGDGFVEGIIGTLDCPKCGGNVQRKAAIDAIEALVSSKKDQLHRSKARLLMTESYDEARVQHDWFIEGCRAAIFAIKKLPLESDSEHPDAVWIITDNGCPIESTYCLDEAEANSIIEATEFDDMEGPIRAVKYVPVETDSTEYAPTFAERVEAS